MDSRVLLVHGDPGILRALESGLRSEGLEVQTAQTGAEGWKIFQTTRPGLVMTAVAVGELDGFSFASRLRQDPIGKTAAVVLVDAAKGSGRRLRAIQAGADSRLIGPDPTRELMTRVRLLFGSPKREAAGGSSTAPRGFACDLGDLDALDLVALVQRNGRSGVATLTAPARVPGSLFFDQGRLIDAQTGHASGLEAFHRLACWTGGALNLEWRNFRRRDVLARPPSELVTSGLAHLEEWTQLLARLGPPNTVFRVDLDALIDRLSSTGGQLTEVLNACDGVRSVVQIVDECSIGAMDVLRSLLQLRDDGLISDPGHPARPGPEGARRDLESTLMGGGAGATHNLPVAAPLVPRAPNPPAPRHDSPATGARLTAPLGQLGLPVSVAEKKNLPAVTMQFPSGLPIPGRTPGLTDAPGMPPAMPHASAPVPPPQSTPAEQKPAQPESLARVTMARSLPPRLSRTQPATPGSTTIALPRAPQVEAGASAFSQTIVPQAPPPNAPAPSVELVVREPAAPAPILTIARPPNVDREITDQGHGEQPFSPHPPAAAFERRGPWWERRNERRPPHGTSDVSSDAQWDPVWPQAALAPPEPQVAHGRAARDGAKAAGDGAKAAGDSPTVYLPASPSTEGARGQRRAPYAEGVRQKPGARGKRAANKARRRRPPLALLIGGAVVLLGALTAIGVALLRSFGR